MSQQSHLLTIKFEILVPWMNGYLHFAVWLLGKDMEEIKERLAININDSVVPCINVNGIHPHTGRIVDLQKVNYEFPTPDTLDLVGKPFQPHELTVDMLSFDETTYFVGRWIFDEDET